MKTCITRSVRARAERARLLRCAPSIMIGVASLLLGRTPQALADEPDRTKAPGPGAAVTWRPPTPVRLAVLGMDGYLVERHELPLVEMSLSWNIGDVLDPAGKEGMHGLCTDLIDEGTRTLSKSALEDKKADLGASLSMSAGRESSRLSLRVVRERLPAALDLVAQLLLEPGLRSDDLERLRAQSKAAVLQERASADSVAGRVLSPTFWGSEHPYGRVVTEKSLDAITEKDCAQVASLYRPGRAQLVVVGDVTATDLQALLGERLASWKGKGPARSTVPAPKNAPGTIFFVDVPGAAQSRILVAHGGPARNAPDYYATSVMTQILGSGLPSRLVQNLREKNGFTYGASAGFRYSRGGSAMAIASSVRTEVTGAALREVMAELKAMTTRPPEDDEVRREREGGVRALPSRFGNGASTLGSISDLLFYDLPLDTWARLPEELGGVSTAQVQKAVADHLRTDGLVVIVAGDGQQVLPALRAIAEEKLFGSAGLVLLDGDGKPKKP